MCLFRVAYECVLASFRSGKVVGVEDIVSQNLNYTYSVKCDSKHGCCYALKREDFCKLQTNTSVWSTVLKLVEQNIEKFSAKIVEGAVAEEAVQQRMDSCLDYAANST